MKQPKKWRETMDPFALTFKNFTLSKILGYPHAGNDVFYVVGVSDGEDVDAFLKVERQTGADVANEIRVIRQLKFPFVPKIIDYSLKTPKFVLTEAKRGDRLSTLVGENENKESHAYLFTYGQTLAGFHQLHLDCEPVKDRRFFHVQKREYFKRNQLMDVYTFLKVNQPNPTEHCFVHGDFHYANLLWEAGVVSAVLDYELSGLGNREFDIAWACLLRPGQKFLDTWEEIELFLAGYTSEDTFDRGAFNYYFVLIASWFYSIGASEPGYQDKLRALIAPVI
ncbi:aminoglycoside phosphotransferase family protein [bacterium]|nr:aminoglycoside phosphotransferase family protein [bacterium]